MGLIWRTLVVTLVLSMLAVRDGRASDDTWPVQRHSLWTIEGGRSPVALLGSIHLLRRQHYPLEWPIEQAFDRAQVVVFETDLGKRMAPEHREVLHRRVRLESRRSLRQQIAPGTYRRLGRFLEGFGMLPTALDRSVPWQAGALVLAMELDRQGYDPAWGVDNYYFRRAEKYGKRTEGLAPIDEHMRLLTELPVPDGDAYVRAALQEAETLRTMMRDIVRAWKGGEEARLETLVNAGFVEHSDLRERLLLERNRQWVPRIERYVDGDEPALVIVGAGHLVGEGSVVDLLRRNGHVVRQR
jgi:hypothetical protein